MHSPSETIPKKRLACDRCHSRKLRCSGDLEGCSRCRRDESVCTYSPALKVGRPSKASVAARETQHETQYETAHQSMSDAAFHSLSDGEALSADSGISMPPSPPHLGDGCITDHTTLLGCFNFTNNLGSLDGAQPFLDMPINDDLWAVPTSPPVGSHEPIIDPRLCPASQSKDARNIPNTVERLSTLQQELLRTSLPSVHPRGSAILSHPAKSVEAALKPAQETLGAVTELLHQCVKNGGDHSDSFCSNWQTVLHLVLTPLSLVLSTYDQILHEIRTAVSSSAQTSTSCMLFDSIECHVAGLRLDRPLRLILLTTVVDYQLNHLYHTVRMFQSEFMHSGCVGIADGMSSSTMTEVQSTIRSLLSVTRKTLQQSQQADPILGV